MPLDFQVAPIAFTEGLDTKTQSKLVVPGKWTTLTNYSLSTKGSPQRRCGIAPLVTGATGNGLALHDDELLTISGGAVSSVSQATSTVKRQPGVMPYLDISEKREVIFNNGFYDSCDTAYGDGLTCTVFREYTSGMTVTGLGVTVTDTVSGAKMLNNSTLILSATAVCPRVVFADNAFFIFYILGANLFCRIIATSAPTTLGAQTSLYLDATLLSVNFDACAFPLGDNPVSVAFVVTGANAPFFSVRGLEVSRVGTTPSSSTHDLVTAANVTAASIQALTCRAYAGSANVGVFLVHTAGGAIAGGLVAVTTDSSLGIASGPALIDATIPPVASPCHVTCTTAGANMQVFTDQQSSYLTANIRPLRVGVVSSALAVVLAFGNLMRSATFRVNAGEAAGPQGPFIAGKAFTTSDSRTFLPVCLLENFNITVANVITQSAQCSAYLVETTDWSTSSSTGTFAVVGGMLYGSLGLVDTTLGGAAPLVTALCSTPTLADGVSFGIALQERGKLSLVRTSGATSSVNATPVGLSTFSMKPRVTLKPISAQLGETTYFAGGTMGAYDGKQIMGFPFPSYPEGINAVANATGLGSLTVGVHQLVAVYEFVDGAGKRWQSGPSPAVSVTVANATDEIDAIVPTTQLSQAAGYTGVSGNLDTMRIVFYMTAAGGLTFYRAPNSFATPLLNTPATSTVSATGATAIGRGIAMPDANLAANEQLYTQPSIAGTTLPNIAPPPSTALAVVQNRLWYDKADKPGWYGYTQQPIVNVGLQFADSLEAMLPASAGHPSGFAELDEKVVIFAREKIFVQFGSGPRPDGSYSSYSLPQDTAADVGCIEPRSILEVPDGVMFQSLKGIYLLTRDLQTRYIGAGVQAYTNPASTSPPAQIYGAMMHGDRSEARFVLQEPGTTTTFRLLVYSFLNDAWSTHLGAISSGGGAPYSYFMNDIAWWPAAKQSGNAQGAVVHITTATSGLHRDNESVFYDTYGANAPLAVRAQAITSWLKVSALEGFQRVRWLYATGSNSSGNTLDTSFTLSVAFDDALAGSNTYNFSFTPTGTEAIDFRHKPRTMKCKSVLFAFLDTPTSGTAQGLTGIEAMALEIGIKKGVHRLPAASSVG